MPRCTAGLAAPSAAMSPRSAHAVCEAVLSPFPASDSSSYEATVSPQPPRSEEHTSELQSRLHLVCRLLLEKKKKHTTTTATDTISLVTQHSTHVCHHY